MDIKDVEVKLNFEKMLAGLFYKDELVKSFNINSKTPGTFVNYFYWDHILEDESEEHVKHEIIIEIGNTIKGMPMQPTFQIYPIAGQYVIHKTPKKCDVRKGTVEDYFNNHKFYEGEDE